MKLNSKNKFLGRLYTLCQIFLDYVTLYGILCGAMYCYYLLGAKYEMSICLKLIFVPFLVIIVNILSRVYGKNLFYPGLGINRIEDLKRSTLSILAGYMLLFAYLALTHSMVMFSRLALMIALLLSILLVPGIRNLFRYICRKYNLFTQPLLIAGAGEQGKELAKRLSGDWFFNVRIVGFLDDDLTGEDILGTLSDCESVRKKYDINYLIVCLPENMQKKHLRSLLNNFCHILLVPSGGLYAMCNSYPTSIARNWAFEVGNKLQMKLYRWEKNILEICLVCFILPFILPVCTLIGLLVKFSSPGPVFYRAKRLGIGGKDIEVLKFRTMYQDSDSVLEQILENDPNLKEEWEKQFKLKKDPRITPIGKFLRRTSLDELPQFWNVLKGDMAVIGPRPIVEAEKAYYGEDFSVFSMVKPGITGLWQISGRSDVDYETRVKMDTFYVSNWSIWLDYYIFLHTFVALLFRRGAR